MRTRLVWKQKLVIPQNVAAIMEWCRRNRYRCYVCFGSDKIADILIRKM